MFASAALSFSKVRLQGKLTMTYMCVENNIMGTSRDSQQAVVNSSQQPQHRDFQMLVRRMLASIIVHHNMDWQKVKHE
jgi:hypothetical protein